MNRRWGVWMAWSAILLALLWGLGSHGLTEPDEGRTAGKAFELFDTGTWLVPRLYGFGHLNKPPMVYWAGALCMHIGGANEWMARLPAALAAFGTLLLTWRIGRRIASPQGAWAAVAVLLTSPLFFAMGRIIDPNMMLTFWSTMAMWSAVAWFQDGRKVHSWIFYMALAGGFLTKGPVIWAIIGLALAGYRFFGPRPTPWRSLFNPVAGTVSIAIGLSWFVIVAQKHPELYRLFLGKELVDRVASDTHGRSEPLLFYFFMLPAGMATWLPVCALGLRRAWMQRRAEPMSRLALWWLTLPLAMFTASTSKMPTYILPLLPGLALLAGRELVQLRNRAGWLRTQLVWGLVSGLLLAPVVHVNGRHEYQWIEGLRWMDLAWLMPGAAVLAFQWKRMWWAGVAAVIASGFLLTADLLGRHDAELGSKSSCRQMARSLKPLVQDGDRVILFRNFPRGLNFYLRHPVTVSTKFELHLQADRDSMADRWYDDEREVGRVYRWFDHEPRVFVVTSDRRRGGAGESDLTPLDHMRKVCRKPLREVYRDDKYVVVCNFPPGDEH